MKKPAETTIGGDRIVSKDEQGLTDKITNAAEKLSQQYEAIKKSASEGDVQGANALLVVPAKVAEWYLSNNKSQYTWIDLGMIWVFELKSNVSGQGEQSIINFGPDDNTTKDLQKHEGVQEARTIALARASVCNPTPVNDRWTFGRPAAYNTLQTANLLQAFLGS